MRQETYGPTDYLLEEVLPALFERLDTCFPEFRWKRNGAGWEASSADGRRYLCDGPRAYHLEGGDARSFLAYVNGGAPPKGREILVAARTIASLVGLDASPLSRELSAADAARFEAAERRRALVETFGSITHAALMGTAGAYARSQLVEARGFRKDDLASLPIGVYTTPTDVAQQMAAFGFTAEELVHAGLLPAPEARGGAHPEAWPGRVVGVWRDRWGSPESVWALDIMRVKGTSGGFPKLDALQSFLVETEDAGPVPTFLYMNGTNRDELVAYGLSDALRSRDAKENLVLVEHPVDALYVQACGFPSVAAVCGSGADLTRARWERLHAYGVAGVTLAFANDLKPDGRWPGRDGTLGAIESWAPVAGAPRLFVSDPGRLGAALDVAELLRDARGSAEPLREVLKERVHAFRYRASALVEAHKPDAEWTDTGKAAALEEALGFDASITVREKFADLELFFWPEVLAATGASADAISARREAARERRSREARRRAYEELLAEASRRVAENRLDEVKGLLRDRVERLGAEERALAVEPSLSVSDELLGFDLRLKRLRGADTVGLPQKTIKALDTATSGLRGLILLAGPPSSGKSTLALQLAMDVLRASPEACALYLSLEMPRWDVLARVKCAAAGVEWKTLVFGSVKNAGSSTSAIFRPEELLALREGEVKLEEISKRMRVLDSRNFPEPTVEKVLAELVDLKARSGATRAVVVVDDLAAWPAAGAAGEAELDRQRVGELKTLRDALDGDPVLAITESRKDAVFPDGFGTARGPRTADLVLLLKTYTDGELATAFKALREKDGRNEVDPQKLAELKESLRSAGRAYARLEIAKGRDGVLRGTIDVTHHYRKSRFEEGRR